MAFSVPKGRDVDPSGVLVDDRALPPLPDDLLNNERGGWLDPRTWFDEPDRPFEIEIGSGKGTFLLKQAEADPGTNYLGIEWERPFAAYSADRVRRRGLKNVRMLCADATSFLRWRCPDRLARVIHLYFSDPWPKVKHHKNRVIQHAFLAQAWRVLTPGGELRVVTDHDDLWAWDVAHFAAWTDASTRASADIPPWIAAATPTGASAFVREPFVPPSWAGDGETVGTNYERKMVGPSGRAHACVLRRSADTSGHG